jgi:hypothetical protein
MSGQVTQCGPDGVEITVRAALGSGGVHAEAVVLLAPPEDNQTV